MGICKCEQTKPCSFCYNLFECCNFGDHPEKCHRYQKYKKAKLKELNNNARNIV